LVLDGGHDFWVAVSQREDPVSPGEVEVSAAVLIEDPATLGTHLKRSEAGQSKKANQIGRDVVAIQFRDLFESRSIKL
jgi:uncharacterized protein YwlG (UPF0340 family)